MDCMLTKYIRTIFLWELGCIGIFKDGRQFNDFVYVNNGIDMHLRLEHKKVKTTTTCDCAALPKINFIERVVHLMIVTYNMI